MIIETKFSPGDVVYYGTVVDKREKAPCEECQGAGMLAIVGKTYRINCRLCCGRGYFHKAKATAGVKRLTIGQVRVEITDSPGTPDGAPFSNYAPQSMRKELYMAVETGIDSGNMYYLEDLFRTEAEALIRADTKLHEWLQMEKEEAERRERGRKQYEREFTDCEEKSHG